MMSESRASLPELLGSLAVEVTGLLHKELELAKAETADALRSLLSAARLMAIGIVLGVGATGVILAALVSGIAAILARLGLEPGVASTVAAAGVGLVVAAASAVLIWAAVSSARAAQESIGRGAASLAADAAVVSERL